MLYAQNYAAKGHHNGRKFHFYAKANYLCKHIYII